MLFWWETRNATLHVHVNMCVRDGCMCIHTCIAREILEPGQGESFFFKVTEKVGRFIVQPCVLVHT